jgi:hypothetical protein
MMLITLTRIACKMCNKINVSFRIKRKKIAAQKWNEILYQNKRYFIQRILDTPYKYNQKYGIVEHVTEAESR